MVDSSSTILQSYSLLVLGGTPAYKNHSLKPPDEQDDYIR